MPRHPAQPDDKGSSYAQVTMSRRAPLVLMLAGMLVCAIAVVVTPTGVAWVGDGSVGHMYRYCDGADLGDISHHRWVNNHRWRNDACGDARDRTRTAVGTAAVGGALAGAGGVWSLARRTREQRVLRRVLLWASPLLALEAAVAGALLPVAYIELLM